MSATGSRFVTITEVGTRDGFQAEKEQISVADKVAVIDALIDAGLRSVEATSFVSPRALPQLADAADVMAQVQRKPGVKLAVLVPNARGAERAAAAKADLAGQQAGRGHSDIDASECRASVWGLGCGLTAEDATR